MSAELRPGDIVIRDGRHYCVTEVGGLTPISKPTPLLKRFEQGEMTAGMLDVLASHGIPAP